MTDCPRCGSLRLNGSGIRWTTFGHVPSEYNLPFVPESRSSEIDEYWCRACLRYGMGDTDTDPAAADENGETAEG